MSNEARCDAPSDAQLERASLLRPDERAAPVAAGAVALEGGASGEQAPPTWRYEALAQARAAAPLILFNALQFSMSAISIAAVGREGAQRMAAAALARCAVTLLPSPHTLACAAAPDPRLTRATPAAPSSTCAACRSSSAPR